MLLCSGQVREIKAFWTTEKSAIEQTPRLLSHAGRQPLGKKEVGWSWNDEWSDLETLTSIVSFHVVKEEYYSDG